MMVIGYKVYTYGIQLKTKKKPKSLLEHNATPWLIFTLILAFWILRNLPLEIFQILAP